MKPPTVFLGEMTTLEVDAFLREHQTVIVPVGSTEQHGPHAPLLTDVLIPVEVARRIAPRVGAVVAPPVNYALSYPHVGFTGVVHIRIPTFMALIEDLCAVARRRSASGGSCSSTATTTTPTRSRMPAPTSPTACRPATQAFPVNYWDGMTPDEAAEFFDPSNGLHANKGETVGGPGDRRPSLVDMELANEEFPPFPEVTSPAPVHTAFFFSSPGSVHRATQSGTWGDAREATPEFGERYLRGRHRRDRPDPGRRRAHARGDAGPLTVRAAALGGRPYRFTATPEPSRPVRATSPRKCPDGRTVRSSVERSTPTRPKRIV